MPLELFVHLNGLADDGKFECKSMKLDLDTVREFPKDNFDFLRYCEVLFLCSSHLKYIFT